MESPFNWWRVEEINEWKCRGPWRTKSEGNLFVNMALSLAAVYERYFSYDEDELKKIPEDIRGFRMYMVRGIPAGKIGGGEFHRIRREIIFGLEGVVDLECEDLFGGRKKFVITPQNGVCVPPSILHTYKAQDEKSGLLVLANTLFDPGNPKTHDTFSAAEFRGLRSRYK